MKSPQLIDLIVAKGENEGMRYTIEKGTYRVMGRFEENPTITEQLTPEGDRGLNPDQQELVNKHISSHARSTRLKHQKRGPDILLDDPSISRTHCMVFIDESGASLADLMSTNGTRVNGTRVQDDVLNERDIIHIGTTKLIVVAG